MFETLFGGEPTWVRLALVSTSVALIAYLLAEITARLVRSVLFLATGESSKSIKDPIVRTPVRVTRALVFVTIFVTLIRPAVEAAGAHTRFGISAERLGLWLFESGLRIALISVLAFMVVSGTDLVLHRFQEEVSRGTGVAAIERAKRTRTLGRLIHNVIVSLVVFVAVLMVLRELKIDIMPVLTGAGLVGLAVGFGAQTLVRDIISGFFLILEDQVRVGDVANINGTGGLVEAINLRTTVLRDLSGTVHVFPNGGITTLANLTKDFSYYVLDAGVAYKEDTDRVAEVLTKVSRDLMEDPRFKPSILAPLEILGVDAFEDSQVTIRTRIKTLPQKQWEVGRELRRRVKKAFDAEGIEIPFPHLSIYFGAESRPWLLERARNKEPGGEHPVE